MIGSSATTLLSIFFGFILFLFLRPSKRFYIILVLSLLYAFLLNGQWALCFLILLITNYYGAKLIEKNNAVKYFLVVLNLGVWAFFKIGSEANYGHWAIIFPLGFSIFIFQQLTFILKEEVNKNITPSEYALYSLFFGNIATGPLFDFTEFKEQFKKNIYLRTEDLYLGGIIFLLGFAKKIVFVDSFSGITIFLFDEKRNYDRSLLFPFLLNKYEIYLNFLAFSEMAIGISLIFGFKLRINFNRPFATTSIIDFWKRWHITLVDWIRNYVFYPLLVSPVSKLGAPFLLLITFLTFALWHGFTLNHVFYGIIQFVLVYLDSRFGEAFGVEKNSFLGRILIFIKWLIFYIFFISIPGLIFRSENLENVYRVLKNLFEVKWNTSWEIFSFSRYGGLALIFFVIANELIETKLNVKSAARFLRRSHFSLQLIIFLLYLSVILTFGMWDDIGNFIYSRY